MEGSLFVLSALYGVVALCVPRPVATSRTIKAIGYGAAAVLALCLALFPFGRMRSHMLQVLANVTGDGGELVELREGLTETISIVEYRWAEHAVAHQLVTDGFSMSSSAYNARRYMKLFVYFPIALRPDPKAALLICYGVGQTAKALTDTASLERIDVVDISRDILELGRFAFPDPGTFPLDDPRVSVHIEDGRFYLQTTSRHYDLITGEPPPPQVAGVVNLYSKEYFELVRDHLTEGGITTYWVPAHQMTVRDVQVVTRAFCDVFADCSLWTGFGYEWMLVGTRGYAGGVSEQQFSRQWTDPRVSSELEAVGFEHPEQLGALFMADAPVLRDWAEGAPPLDDDHPDRLGHRFDPPADDRHVTFHRWMDPDAARDRFLKSELISRLWPASLREHTIPYFSTQKIINTIPDVEPFQRSTRAAIANTIDRMHVLQTQTDLRTPVLWMFGFTAANEAVLDRADTKADPTLELPRAVRALADRHYDEAATRLATIDKLEPNENITLLRIYALVMAGRPEEARSLAPVRHAVP
jgi:spermidine synthase